MAGRSVVYGHVVPGPDLGDTVRRGARLGVIETFPTVLSDRHQDRLLAARRLYAQGQFLDAAATVAPALDDEPKNLFLLNEYARALFRVDSLKPRSRRVYARLVALVDTAFDSGPRTLVVDMWFVDAYWKLALLDLDAQDYSGALRELIKVTFAPELDARFREQLYSYLAEAYYHLGDRGAAQWFVDRTLELNPANTYVLPFRSGR